jgi:hypothetical protein
MPVITLVTPRGFGGAWTTVTSRGEPAPGFDACACDPPMLDGLADECGVTSTALGAGSEDSSWALPRWETGGASWLTPTRVMVATVPALSRARIVVATPVVLPVSLTRREPAFLPMRRSPIALPGTRTAPGLTTVLSETSPSGGQKGDSETPKRLRQNG